MRISFTSSESRNLNFRRVSVVISVMLTAIATSAIVLGCFGTASLHAQGSRAMAPSRMDGDWQNVDPNTRDLVEIVIKGVKIHPYGQCHPTVCDWGVIKAKSFASNVNSTDISRLLAKKHNDFDTVEITLSLEADGRLRAECFTHFIDQSGRADYSTVNYFNRGRRPYMPY
jgi:hypothetical protein